MIPFGYRPSALAAVLFLSLSYGVSQAQVEECIDCTLGLYADSALTQSQVVVSGPVVDLWLGIKYGSDPVRELTGIEFSISGLEYFYAAIEPLDHPTAVIGTPEAPAGIDTVFGTGGMNIAWPQCLSGERPLARLTLVPRGGWPPETTLRVKHRYPPTNVAWNSPVLSRCDDPYYTVATLHGTSFLLQGPEGGSACAVDVRESDFGTIREGWTATLPFTISNGGEDLLAGEVSEEEDDFVFQESDLTYSLPAGQSRSFTLQFTPTRPGRQTCLVHLGAGCDTLRFTGAAPDVLPIAVVAAKADSLVTQAVTIEGQASVVGYQASYNRQYWVDDGSGRGLYVKVFPYHTGPAFEDRSRRARISGLLDIAGRLELQSVTAFSIVSEGNPLPVPRAVTARQAAHPASESAYIQVTGNVGSVSNGRYYLSDGTGTVGLYLGFEATIPLGRKVQAAGAGTSDGSGFYIHVGNPEDLLVGSPCGLRTVTLQGAQGIVGDSVDVAVALEHSIAEADTIRLRLTYDSNVVQLAGATCTGLASAWTHCGWETLANGTSVVEAWDSTPLAANSSGEILRLRFVILGCSPHWSPVEITAVEADLAGMDRCGPAQIVCTQCVSDGDLDGNGQLTPGDAQCAFEIFLTGESTPVACGSSGDCSVTRADHNCDRQVTPSDALAIFGRWLGREPTPSDCLGRALGAPEGLLAKPAQSLYRIDPACARSLGGGLVELPLEWRAAAGAAAFGAEVHFDRDAVRFDAWRPAAASVVWQGLGARESGSGVLRVGGFAASLPEPVVSDAATIGAPESPADDCRSNLDGWTALGTLVFRADLTALRDVRIRWLEQVTGGPSSFAPETIVLAAPHPNPAVRGEVLADLLVPRASTVPLQARILDVRGRQVRVLELGSAGSGVRTLRWDLTDATGRPVAAGLYVLEVRDAARAARRKIVVIR